MTPPAAMLRPGSISSEATGSQNPPASPPACGSMLSAVPKTLALSPPPKTKMRRSRLAACTIHMGIKARSVALNARRS
eukprot:CAMPEP_0117461622 /NCGR_PEP_ID=MMETSP0784-20121206/2623_1 /TAXON_ID=39447 /ORGANISM="" /LENGTH=77 /DNA_ID=CAMNT_0005255341 /DNA_START=707 /DNA_END=940 /DNA_ORIENTATION=-